MGLCVSKSSASDFMSAGVGDAAGSSGVSGNGKSWSDMVSNIRNPDDDSRVAALINMIGMIYDASKTLRERMNIIDREGGVALRIVPDGDIQHSFGHAETLIPQREAVIAQSTAQNVKGGHFRPLNIMLVELTNMSRANDFQRVMTKFDQGYCGVERAAHDLEQVEYQTTLNMGQYYKEARSVIQHLDYGTPSLWYLQANGDAYYPTFEHYFRNMCDSGHTDAYRNNLQRTMNERSA
ncbi:hypothetical protein [Brenneria goodwinii]|uniref:Uncharacterized protein n=1 Tax=Brenneria goodwinii TaxID=1109412 RepID=A0A0G4JVG2_9GAMM|nr:hypothetical protein [Brenneria goodwinii]CPR17003.1 hypothetical protein BN1221_02396 [Brenneria goodwinii]